MPCPLFLPGSLLPLSDIYAGKCSADSRISLSIETLTRCCNPGYARAVCPYAARTETDSHRFLVTSDDGGSIEVAWASERDHHPVAVGKVCFKHAPDAVSGPLEHQARAFVLTYLHQTGRG